MPTDDDFMANIDATIAETTGGTVGAQGSPADESSGNEADDAQQQQANTSKEPAQEGAEQVAADNAGGPPVKPRVRRPAGKQVAGQKPEAQQQAPARDPNDLYGADGKLIAKAGRERRYYDSWNRAERNASELKQQVTNLNQQVETYRAATTQGQQLGLSPNEQVIGMQMVAAWKKDPAAAIKAILTQAKAQGISVDLEGMQPGVDADAILQRIRQEFAPVLNQAQAQTEMERVSQEAQRNYDAFMSEFPDAAVQQREIAAVMNAKGLNPREAYYAVRAWCVENGYDWTKPLGPQHAAKQQQAAGNTNQGRSTQPRVPLTGRSVGGPVNNGVKVQRSPAGVNDSWDTIVKQTAQEFGIEI